LEVGLLPDDALKELNEDFKALKGGVDASDDNHRHVGKPLGQALVSLKNKSVRAMLLKSLARSKLPADAMAAFAAGSTPSELGWRMPAEFEPHRATVTAWPWRPDTWRNGAAPARAAVVAVASIISRYEPTYVLARAEEWKDARAALPPRVHVVEASFEDIWLRDSGPTCLVRGGGESAGVCWRFNAWGGADGPAYWPCPLDEAVGAKVCELFALHYFATDLILEGAPPPLRLTRGRRVDSRRRGGDASDDGGVPPQPQPQPRAN
jgi:hypothetical protein